MTQTKFSIEQKIKTLRWSSESSETDCSNKFQKNFRYINQQVKIKF